MDQLLSKLYNDPKTGFVGAQKLYLKARSLGPSITLKKMRDWPNSHSNVQRFQDQKPVLQQFRMTSLISDPLFSNKTPGT